MTIISNIAITDKGKAVLEVMDKQSKGETLSAEEESLLSSLKDREFFDADVCQSLSEDLESIAPEVAALFALLSRQNSSPV